MTTTAAKPDSQITLGNYLYLKPDPARTLEERLAALKRPYAFVSKAEAEEQLRMHHHELKNAGCEMVRSAFPWEWDLETICDHDSPHTLSYSEYCVGDEIDYEFYVVRLVDHLFETLVVDLKTGPRFGFAVVRRFEGESPRKLLNLLKANDFVPDSKELFRLVELFAGSHAHTSRLFWEDHILPKVGPTDAIFGIDDEALRFFEGKFPTLEDLGGCDGLTFGIGHTVPNESIRAFLVPLRAEINPLEVTQ